MTRFARTLERLHRVGINQLADSVADYYSADGLLVASGVPVVMDHGVEEVTEFGGIDRRTTIGATHIDLKQLQRNGFFIVAGKRFAITGIQSDDHHYISFYVRPDDR